MRELPQLEESGRWFVKGENKTEAKLRARQKAERLSEIGIEIDWEYAGIDMKREDTVAFKIGQDDEDVPAFHEITYTVEADNRERYD